MARKIAVELVADSASLEKGFRRASSSASHFDKSITHAARGALAGSGAFEHLGRSLAFASGGFVAFAGITDFLRDSVSAARDAQKAQASLAAQMKAVGETFSANKKRIEEATLSYGRFGFENDEVTKSLTVLERGTGSITRALSLQLTVANLARAKNIDLASAANVVAKVFGGQETALRRAVPGLEKTAHGMDLIREASAKLAGQAAANTTAADRFAATLHDTKEIIGTALLPILDKYLNDLGGWLQKMNESGRLQRDVNEAVKTGTGIFQGIKAVVVPLAGAFRVLGKAVGGTKNEVELLTAAFIAFKTKAALGNLGLLAIGSSAESSAAKVGALRLALGRLGAIGVITVGIELLIHRKQVGQDISKAVQAVTTAGQPSPLGISGGSFSLLGSGDTRPDENGNFPNIHFNFPGGPSGSLSQIIGQKNAQSFGLPNGASGSGNLPLTAAQQFQLALAANPDDIGLLKQKAAHDRAAIAFAARLRDQGRISNKKYIAEVLGYEDDLHSTLAHIASATKKAAANRSISVPGTVSGSGAGSPFLKVPGSLGGRGSFSLGFKIPMQLQLALLRDQAFGNAAQFITDTKRVKALALKALKSGHLALQAQADALNAIIDANSKIGQTLKKVATAVSSRTLTAGLGLDRGTRKALESRLALAGAFSGHVPTTMGVLGQSVNVGQIILPNVDPYSVADSIGKLGRTKPPQTRGISAGRSRALP